MPTCLSLGTFDGVHLGHQKIIRTLVRESRLRGYGSVAVYFPLPPKFFFSGERENCLITLPAEREALLKSCGAGRVEMLPFGAKLASMSAESFFRRVVLGAYGAREVAAGRDFAFGKDREGNAEFLEKRCAAAGVGYKAVPFASYKGHKISSSLIRAFLRSGRIEDANKCLGRNYSAAGKVVKGAGVGRALGFPTANIGVDPAKILPPGVFAAKARLGGETFSAVLNIGRRPTIGSLGGRLLLEAHILDFDRLIYGRRLEVEFLKHLRPEKKFRSREHLKEQISSDIALARKYFRAREKSRTRLAARA
ncbi:MAG: riboflavin biosynthesis protein RibF [Elusimicrobia bacterium RIFOXYB2_FULL_62_6]|nr:MAG: riboflavin biosynthesis protein RibF [Elusimicrobia bacterium RIFOXYB2_FULL_62_6]